MKVFSSVTPLRSLVTTKKGRPDPSLPLACSLNSLVWLGNSAVPAAIKPERAKYWWPGVTCISRIGFLSTSNSFNKVALITFAPSALTSIASTSFCKVKRSLLASCAMLAGIALGASTGAVLVLVAVDTGTSLFFSSPLTGAASCLLMLCGPNSGVLPSYANQLL